MSLPSTRVYFFDSGIQLCKSKIDSMHQDVPDGVKRNYKISKSTVNKGPKSSKIVFKYDPSKKELEYSFGQILEHVDGNDDYLVVLITGKVGEQTDSAFISPVTNYERARQLYKSEFRFFGFPSKAMEKRLLGQQAYQFGTAGGLHMRHVPPSTDGFTSEFGKLKYTLTGDVQLLSFQGPKNKELVTNVDTKRYVMKYTNFSLEMKAFIKLLIPNFKFTTMNATVKRSAIGYPTSNAIEAALKWLDLSVGRCGLFDALLSGFGGGNKNIVDERQQLKEALACVLSGIHRDELALPYSTRAELVLGRFDYPLLPSRQSSVIVQHVSTCIRNNGELYNKRLLNVYSFDTSATPGGRNILLWHGTKRSNICSILNNGFRCSKRGNFGPGIYFADVVCKAVTYCEVTTECILLLNEVQLGICKSMNSFQTSLTEAPSGYQSVLGVGKRFPDPTGSITDEFGSEFNVGSLLVDAARSRKLDFNEYVVYDAAQIKLRYLVHITTS